MLYAYMGRSIQLERFVQFKDTKDALNGKFFVGVVLVMITVD